MYLLHSVCKFQLWARRRVGPGFLKRIEERYGDERRADAERPVVKIDGSRPGDRTVTYDKGGWVFWMMDRDLAGADAGRPAQVHRRLG